MKKKLMDVTKKSGVVFGGRIIGLIGTFLFSLVVARYIGPDAYGKFMYIYTLIIFAAKIAKLGLDQGIVSFIPKLTSKEKIRERNGLISFSLIITFISAIIVASLFIINSQFIAKVILNDAMLSNLLTWMTPLIILLTFIHVFQGIFRGIEVIKYYIIGKNILNPALRLVIVFILSFCGYKIFGIITSYYIALIMTSVYMLKKAKKLNLIGRIKYSQLSNYWEVLKFSFPLLMSGFLAFFINKTDTFMIGYFLDNKQVGIYSIALRVGILSSFILTAFNKMFAPIISKLYHQNQMKKLSDMYKIITKWILTLNLVAFSLILIFSENIMYIFGQEFVKGADALILISIGQVVNSAVGSAGYINIMTGNPQYNLYTNIITLLLNILLNYNLIPIYGIEGAAFASFMSVGATNIIRLLLVYKEHKIHPYSYDYIKPFISISVSVIIVFILDFCINFNVILQFIFLVLIFMIIFILSYYWLGLSNEDQMILDAILTKIRNI